MALKGQLLIFEILDRQLLVIAEPLLQESIIRLPQCTNTTLNFASLIAHLLAAHYIKQIFHKSCKTYHVTNQSACLLKPTKFLI